jgi:HAD superfamily hydrolase (TIGR01549 family)
MLKAVLFDLDGTLMDWSAVEPWENYESRRLARVFEFVNRELYPLTGVDPDAFFTTYIAQLTDAWKTGNRTLCAPSILDIMARTLQASGVPDDRLEIESAMRAYNWQPANGLRAYPDALEVLPELEAQGIAMGIITNSSFPMSYRDQELRTVGLLELFPTCRVSAVDVGYLKPHQGIFDHALQLLGIQASEAVFVGDNLEADIGGAQNAGIYNVLRIRESQEMETGELDIIPDGTVSSFHELLPLLDGWFPGWRNGCAR